MTNYRVHAAPFWPPCANFIPNWATVCFRWVSRTSFSSQMALMRSKASPRCPKKVPTKPENCTAAYTGSALLKKGIPLTDENLGMNNMLSHLEEDGLKMHDAVPTLYQQSVMCSLAQLGSQSNEPGTNKDNPIEAPPSSPTTRPAFLHQ